MGINTDIFLDISKSRFNLWQLHLFVITLFWFNESNIFGGSVGCWGDCGTCSNVIMIWHGLMRRVERVSGEFGRINGLGVCSFKFSKLYELGEELCVHETLTWGEVGFYY